MDIRWTGESSCSVDFGALYGSPFIFTALIGCAAGRCLLNVMEKEMASQLAMWCLAAGLSVPNGKKR